MGIGAGEQDRVGVAEIAVLKAYRNAAQAQALAHFGKAYAGLAEAEKAEIDAQVKADRAGLQGSVMISDAFFPFRDGAEVGIREGVSAILQAGGSIRDFESIEACNEARPQVAMKFTGCRSFKH